MKNPKFTLIALGVLFIAACSKNNNSSNPNPNAQTYIQGTWKTTGMTYYFYNSSNQVVYSENVYDKVGFVQYLVFTKDFLYVYFNLPDSNILENLSNYTLNTSVSPMTLTGDRLTNSQFSTTIPLLTASQMVWFEKQTPDSYSDSTTGQSVQAAYSIRQDTLVKQ